MSEMDLTENWQIITGETFSVRYAYVGRHYIIVHMLNKLLVFHVLFYNLVSCFNVLCCVFE